jgi:hypothetical protein
LAAYEPSLHHPDDHDDGMINWQKIFSVDIKNQKFIIDVQGKANSLYAFVNNSKIK